ncbi:PQQ-like beta-propeller repeat protein [candidate division KSB1 bacterium]|nr:PQQ-like beta-propeller repeat protein [candidate division KSB1 bacterium]
MTKKQIKIFVIVYLFGSFLLWAGDNKDWPCFHGSDRKNLSRDTGLLTTWPEKGPELLWVAGGLGQGYSSVAVAGDRIFTAGKIDKETHVVAISYDGDILWQRAAGESWQASERQRWAITYAGSRATPTIDDGTVYFLSELGHLIALDAESGEQRWALNCADTFEAEKPEYGYSESVLVEGDRLFCCPAGRKAYMVALDKNTGDLLWANTEIDDPVGNSSPVSADIDGIRQMISLSASTIFAVAPKDGKLLWKYPFANNRTNNCTDVIVYNGLVYASTGYGKGSVLLRPERAPEGTFKVNVVWESELLDNHHGGVVLVDGFLYGAGHEAKGWTCLDFLTGSKKWQTPGKGSLTYADDHLYCLDERGKMLLVKADAKESQIAQFDVPKGGSGAYWAHPVVCGGRLYIRHSDQLYVYDVRKKSAP